MATELQKNRRITRLHKPIRVCADQDTSDEMAGTPMNSNREQFKGEVFRQISMFEESALVRRVSSRTVSLCHYHSILSTIFHQTRSGPYTFALAAVHCSWNFESAKEYLLKHAEEERTHWRWVLDDLTNTGYAGPCPMTCLPHHTCETYISFNERVARQCPVARLAIAAVLEGIGASFGGTYGRELIDQLGLNKRQATFFISHGQTDKVHIQELDSVIDETALDEKDWGWMKHAAATAGRLYRDMFSHEAFR